MTKELLWKNYADVLLEVGLDLRKGDRLKLSFDEDSLPLAREVVRAAYRLGAEHVKTEFSDDAFTLAFYENGSDEALSYFPPFFVDERRNYFEENYHILSITSANPELLKDIPQEKLMNRQKIMSERLKPLRKYTMQNLVKWCIAMVPSKTWAEKVFPGDERAEEKLLDAICRTCRLDREDPVQAWKEHNRLLKEKEDWLNSEDFDHLLYKAPGTDLKVGLVKGHRWVGGSSEMERGDSFIANIPTEEIFTMPDKYRVDGTLRSTKPLASNGKVIRGMEFCFEKGKVVSFRAEENEEVLRDLLAMDDNASYLGEVALVSDDTPISQSGILFYTTLFDENASCHFALGSAYSENLPGSENLTEEEMDKAGMNESRIHVDFMVGGPELSIDGVKKDGSVIPILRNGIWVK